MTTDEKYQLSEKIAKAIAEYLDGFGGYPDNILRMPLAEYVVDEVIEPWADSLKVATS